MLHWACLCIIIFCTERYFRSIRTANQRLCAYTAAGMYLFCIFFCVQIVTCRVCFSCLNIVVSLVNVIVYCCYFITACWYALLFVSASSSSFLCAICYMGVFYMLLYPFVNALQLNSHSSLRALLVCTVKRIRAYKCASMIKCRQNTSACIIIYIGAARTLFMLS